MGVSNKEQSLDISPDKRGASLSSPVYHMYPDATFALTVKKRRNALIALASRYGWEIGYLDEVWWSRLSQPNLHSWSEKDEPLRSQELEVSKTDPDPKALACYGMLSADSGRMHLRFVAGCPISQVTTDFLEWLCKQVQAQGKAVLVLIWDNASCCLLVAQAVLANSSLEFHTHCRDRHVRIPACSNRPASEGQSIRLTSYNQILTLKSPASRDLPSSTDHTSPTWSKAAG